MGVLKRCRDPRIQDAPVFHAHPVDKIASFLGAERRGPTTAIGAIRHRRLRCTLNGFRNRPA
jgi:hypothetical protein